MSVFVSVQMQRLQTRIENPFDLRAQLRIGLKPAQRHRVNQLANRAGKVLTPARERGALDQHQMTADIQLRVLAGETDRIVEGRAVRHQGGGRQDALRVSLDDPEVHIASEAEVVRVDDEYCLCQNSASLIRRYFFGLSRMARTSCCISPVAPFSVS